VHRRTLVTSGIILLLINNWILKYYLFSIILFIFSLLRFLFSGLLNLVEQDLKKIIALRTLSQLSLCMLRMGLCLYLISYSYIVIHALVKSLLFMVVGHIIYVSYGIQNLRNLSIFNNILNLSLINIRLFRLCGLIFLAIIILKESLLSYLIIREIGLILLLIYMGGFLITFIYCIRIIFVGINSCRKNNYFFFSYSYLLSRILFFFIIFFWYIDFTRFFFLPIELGRFFNIFFFCFFIYSRWLLKINNISLVVKNIFLCNYFLLQLSRFLVWTPYFESFINKILLEFFIVLSYLRIKIVLLTSSNFSIVFIRIIRIFLFLV
jgi:NADH:ubiquinone oxidoreductase subunit 5 (subunit L)/multisubunit Na+/H+ antiporter MnhA subunit